MHTNLLNVLAIVILISTACKEKESTLDELGRANAPAQTNEPAMTPQESESGSTASTGKMHVGTILETTDVKDYTYIRFRDKQELEHWAAVMKGKFEIGKTITIVESIVMKDFTSPTLNKTFDSIIFGNAANGRAPDEPSAAPPGMPMEQRPINSDKSNASPILPKGHPPIN